MEEKIILLVEDNSDDEIMMLYAFKINRITNPVVVVRDGAQALDYLLPNGAVNPLPNLILLDLKLPKINGLEVLKRLRAEKRTRYIPVVVLTSSAEEQDIISSYDLGANSFVQKNADFDNFLKTANHLGVYWLQNNLTVYSNE